MKLYSYFRSSAAYRVRIALNLKGLPYENLPVHLTRGGGEQLAPGYRKLNPQALVPVLEDGGRVLTQSLAIIEYLDETHPQPPLLPRDAGGARAGARARAGDRLRHPPAEQPEGAELPHRAAGPQRRREADAGTATGSRRACSALEASLAGDRETGKFCHGDAPGLADCCLVPQLANAHRFKCDVAPYPTLLAIEKNCQALDAFQRAAPEQQPDAE